MVEVNNHCNLVFFFIWAPLGAEKELQVALSHTEETKIMGQNSSHKMCSPGLSLSSGLGDKKEGLCCCPGELGPGVLVSVSRNVAGSGRADTVVSFECYRKVVHQPHLAMSSNYCVGYRKSWRQTTSEMTSFLYQPWKEHGQTEALLM